MQGGYAEERENVQNGKRDPAPKKISPGWPPLFRPSFFLKLFFLFWGEMTRRKSLPRKIAPFLPPFLGVGGEVKEGLTTTLL